MSDERGGATAQLPAPGTSGVSVAELGRRLWSGFQRWASANPEAIARLMVWIYDQVLENEEEPDLLSLGRSFMFGVAPPNWQSLSFGAHTQVDRLICETGLCLVWVPDADVITRLLRASDKNSRDDVLLANESRILDSIIARIDEVRHPEIEGLRDLAVKAVEAHRSGFCAPAQTLAGAIVTGVIEDHYGFKFVAARKAFSAEPPAAAGLWSHRRALVQRALHIAIAPSKPGQHERGFNRHLTSHGTDPDHYDEARAIEGLMLMAASLRELNETYRVADMGFGPSPRLAKYAEQQSIVTVDSEAHLLEIPAGQIRSESR